MPTEFHLWMPALERPSPGALRVLQVALDTIANLEGTRNVFAPYAAHGDRAARGWLGADQRLLDVALCERRGDGLDLYHGLKTPPVFSPLLHYIQAGAYARSGRPAEGLGMIDDAIEIAGSERTVPPELYLLKGDLLLVVESGSAAESWFQLGFDMAEGLDQDVAASRLGQVAPSVA